jgi:ribosomal-protein-alanine N-acetyltransferase
MVDPIPFVVEPMALSDLDQVMAIEKVAFSRPWPEKAYRHELTATSHSIFLVVRPAARRDLGVPGAWQEITGVGPGPLLGYIGGWLLVDELHVATIAVHPRWREKGLGELLLLALLGQAADRGAKRATLEVRVSNLAGQGLYQKYGFRIVSQQKRYYADNNEDAYIMATPGFHKPEFVDNLRLCRTRLRERLVGRAESEPSVQHAGCA